jgi:hypothetical protein
MGPPKRRGPETEEQYDQRELEPWERAALRGMIESAEHRKWLRGVMWKVLAWGGAFVVLLSSLKEEITSWFSRGSP